MNVLKPVSNKYELLFYWLKGSTKFIKIEPTRIQ